MSRIEDVRRLAEPMVASRGFALYDIEQHGPVLRVTVGGAAGGSGPGIDDLSSITRELSRLLDETDPIAGSYTLEVSSPGLERRLRTPEHFSGAIGETASVKIRIAGQPAERIRGVISAVDPDQGVRLAMQNSDGKPTGADRHVTFADIDSARTIFEWGMTPPEPPAKTGQPDDEPPGPTRRTAP